MDPNSQTFNLPSPDAPPIKLDPLPPMPLASVLEPQPVEQDEQPPTPAAEPPDNTPPKVDMNISVDGDKVLLRFDRTVGLLVMTPDAARELAEHLRQASYAVPGGGDAKPKRWWKKKKRR